jgi:hypothetical protein
VPLKKVMQQAMRIYLSTQQDTAGAAAQKGIE